MTSYFGRLESQSTNSSSWTGTVDVGGGAQAWTVTASSRYPTDLCTAFASALTTAAGEGITVTPAFGEGGTGLVVIDRTAAGTMAIVWTSTDLRDLLGFTGNLSAANNYTSTYVCDGVWLPDCPMNPKYGQSDEGHYEVQIAQTVNPSGYMTTIIGSSRQKLQIDWSHISRDRARQQADGRLTPCFEHWLKKTQLGGVGYFTAGNAVRVYWSADVGTYKTYSLLLNGSTEMERVDPAWSGLWPISITGYRTPGT